MTLDSWEFKDPMLVAEERESRTCKGCIWEIKIPLWNEIHSACQIQPAHTSGRRCRKYHNPTEDNA